ncbi:MAG: 4-hydroxy-tetrahydrodipicolinate reductase [Deltaproteobacteria bacterium]|nr:MAG: 4-hydroxy-tetrahydrodipicolinate reductase [Deltaproteobacteria bacterium]
MKVCVIGAGGRMGRVITRLILTECSDLSLASAVEAPGSSLLGRDAGELSGAGECGVAINDDLEGALRGADVAIDFTAADASVKNAKAAAEAEVPIVIGSTGLSREQREEIARCGEKIPIVLAPNMSVGVNLLFKLVRDAVRALGPDYDVEIVEIHHRFKKDAPSGTAVRLGEIVAEEKGLSLEEHGVFGRKGFTGERKKEEIGLMTLRAGDVVGEHTVVFGGLGERVELTHRAHTRETFARGAIRAARWVVNQSPGLYDMQDVLNIR